MKLLTCIVAFMISVSAAAAAPKFVVKVKSRTCSARTELEGSGNLISIKDKIYVLTSDHVVLHGTKADGVCSSVALNGQELTLELQAANFLLGTALLEVLHPNAAAKKAALPVQNLISDMSEVGGFGALTGVPALSDTAVVDNSGQILSTNGTRHVLPLVTSWIEVRGHSEFGMSGGALVTESGKMAGLISHQYLKLNLGTASTIHEYDAEGAGGEIVALVIPGSLISKWIDSALAHAPGSDVRLDADMQKRGILSAVFEGIRFTGHRCKSGGASIGGEGVGIGGEGVGIGGAGEQKICQISVHANQDTNSWNNSAWPLSEARWFKQLKERILGGASADVSALYYKGRQYTLNGFIPLFAGVQAGAIPLTNLKVPFPEDSEPMRRLHDLHDKLVRAMNAHGSFQAPADSELIGEIQRIAESLANNDFGYLAVVDWKELQAHSDWTQLLEADFLNSVEIKSQLLRVQDSLRQMGISLGEGR